MEKIFLDAQLREEIGRGRVKHLRDQGFVPAVIYGDKKGTHPIKLSHRELVQLLHQHGLENLVINLRIKNDKKERSHSCLIKEIQYDPVQEDIIHVDFNEISLTEKIKVNVPVTTKGEPIGVKQEGGSLEHILWEIELECLPMNIPQELEVDVSKLKMNESVHVKDMSIPAEVKVLTDPEAVVLSVVAPIKEEEVVPAEGAEAEELQEPEVIKEKKPEAAEGGEEVQESKPKEKEKGKE
jgi:large subunit ribosomal protein L25